MIRRYTSFAAMTPAVLLGPGMNISIRTFSNVGLAASPTASAAALSALKSATKATNAN